MPTVGKMLGEQCRQEGMHEEATQEGNTAIDDGFRPGEQGDKADENAGKEREIKTRKEVCLPDPILRSEIGISDIKEQGIKR